MRAAVLTVSNRASNGVYEDLSGPIARELLQTIEGIAECDLAVVHDDRSVITETLRRWSDSGTYAIVVTNGGTGISPRDLTPEATRDVLDYEVPGISELMRASSLKKTPMAALSRALCGVRGRTLIINLPGSPKAVRECLEAILPILPHALEQLRDGSGHSN